MPSGAKKRKAAKKKKESQSSNHSNPSPASTQSHGDEDVKHQEDKESDAGEVSSPASQDHHSHQNLLIEADEEEIEKKRNLPSPALQELKIEGGEKNIVVEENVVEVEREFKIEGESDKNQGPVEDSESTRKSYDGGSSRSSSGGSSDDESRGIKNGQAPVDTAPVVDSVKKSDSSSRKSGEAIHIAPINGALGSVENTHFLGESVLNQNGVGKPSSAEDKVGASMASVNAALEKEKEIVQSVQNADTNPNECIKEENDGKLTSPCNAPRPTGAGHETNSGVTEQLPMPQAPVRRTSWKSCCGLFEVFSGSST